MNRRTFLGVIPGCALSKVEPCNGLKHFHTATVDCAGGGGAGEWIARLEGSQEITRESVEAFIEMLIETGLKPTALPPYPA